LSAKAAGFPPLGLWHGKGEPSGDGWALLCQQIRAVSRRTACRNSESIPCARPRLAVLGKTVVRKICLSIAGGWKMAKGRQKK
jgi:hypothetical protein